jgi:hypothetical protein
MRELRCRCCSTVIGKLVPSEQQTVRRVGSQTFIQERMVFSYLPNYREVEIEMDLDGRKAKHVANICVDCVGELQYPHTLARFYETDLAQWRSEGHSDIPHLMRAAKPTRVLRSDTFIKD